MCWSGEASAVVAALGYASAFFCWKRGESKMLWAPIVYFASMEALQAYTYTSLDECSNPHNQAATFIAYVHICFQPVFINALSLYFLPERLRSRIQYGVYALAAFLGVLYLLRIFPFEWLRSCVGMRYAVPFIDRTFPVPLCGKRLCAISGNWHIAWEIPLRYSYYLDTIYVLSAFIMPVLYGSWRITLYMFLAGPVLAGLTTDNPNEWPAVWCLFSTLIIGVAVQPKLRRRLHVKTWFGVAIGAPPAGTAAPAAHPLPPRSRRRA